MTDRALFDAIVVGAGFSGLMAARRLRAAGRRIRVLEARSCVGGRVRAAQLAGHDRATVQNDRWQIEPRGGHGGARNRFIASDEEQHGIQHMPADREFG